MNRDSREYRIIHVLQFSAPSYVQQLCRRMSERITHTHTHTHTYTYTHDDDNDNDNYRSLQGFTRRGIINDKMTIM